MLVLGLWLAADILAADVLHDTADVVVLAAGELAARAHDNLVATSTEVFLVVDQEVLASLKPHFDLVPPSIGRGAHLHR